MTECQHPSLQRGCWPSPARPRTALPYSSLAVGRQSQNAANCNSRRFIAKQRTVHTCVVVENLTLSFGCCRGHLQNIPNRKASSHFFSTFHQFHSVISPTFVYLIASLDSKLAVYGRHWYRSPRNEPASLCLRVKILAIVSLATWSTDRPDNLSSFQPSLVLQPVLARCRFLHLRRRGGYCKLQAPPPSLRLWSAADSAVNLRGSVEPPMPSSLVVRWFSMWLRLPSTTAARIWRMLDSLAPTYRRVNWRRRALGLYYSHGLETAAAAAAASARFILPSWMINSLWCYILSCSEPRSLWRNFCNACISFLNQYTWGPRGPQAYVLCDILRSVRYFFAKLYVFLNPSYVIIVTKYHLLGLGPKSCTYNFALGSAWTPSTSILRHSVSMSLIVYLWKIFAW